MLIIKDIVNYLLHYCAIALAGLGLTSLLIVLLYGPNSPQRNVGQVDSLHHRIGLALSDECVKRLLCCVHYLLEVAAVVYRQRSAGQRDKLVACTNLKPGISCKYILSFGALHIELLCAVFHTVVEACARCAGLDFSLVHLSKAAGAYLRDSCREDDALTLLDIELEVTRHIQILAIRNAALLVLDILNTLVPVGLEHKLHLVAALHVECRITGIHASGNSVLHFLIISARNSILHAKVVGITECQERTELERGLRVGIYKGVANEDTVLMRNEDFLLRQNHSSHTIGGARHGLAIILSDVLVPIRAVAVVIVLVKPQIEGSTVLNHSFVER